MQSTIAKKKTKRRRWILGGGAVILLVTGLLLLRGALGGPQDSRAAGQPKPAQVATAFVGDLSAKVSASGQVESAQIAQLSVNTPGIVARVPVRVGDAVQAGDVLVQLQTDDLALQVEQAEQNLALSQAQLEALQQSPSAEDVAAAKAAVHSAQAALDELRAGPRAQDIAASEAELRAQQANVASASAAYQGTLESISDAVIAAAQADLLAAQIAYDEAQETADNHPNGRTYDAFLEASEQLEIAQAALDELLAGPNQGTVSSAAASISAAAANADQAAANHALLLSGASTSQIAAAEANLAQAQANLANLTAGPTDEALTVAQTQVEQARLTLADAQETLAKATIKAPFAGRLTQVYIEQGEYTTGTVVELVSNELYVLLSVDEMDVGALTVGQPARVTLEPWPDIEIAAEISSIAPSANVGLDGIVSFDVRLDLGATDLPVLVGMTTDAELITAQRENVLLVPNAAITANRQAGTFSVNLITGEAGEVKRVPVTIGLQDTDWTEITSGLTEGDQVAVGELKTPTRRVGPFGGS